jgi:phage recombination protein Bet
MNATAKAPALVEISIPSLKMHEDELVRVLESSIYPGARLDSIKLVVGYCRANHLDPMTKPVHIVPMDVKVKGNPQDPDPKKRKDWYQKRDVVMPGIELYRTKAARTKEYLGCSEPMFGPTLTKTFKEKQWYDDDDGQGGTSRTSKMVEAIVEYPEWVKVVAKRLVGGVIAEFPAIEFWEENYATQSRDSTAPNAMWKKRPFGQLAKCAEAQALRKAFPELGGEPTADEMTGKVIDETGNPVEPDRPASVMMPREKQPTEKGGPVSDAQVVGETKKPAAAAEQQDAGAREGELMERTAKKDKPPAADTSGPAPANMIALIRKKAEQATVTEAEICKKYQLEKLDSITLDMGNVVLAWLRNPGEAE